MALAVVGCVSGDETFSTGSEYWCDGFCKASRRCGNARTQDACRGSCSAFSPHLDSISLHGAELMGECIAELGCDVIGGDDEFFAAQDQCWQQSQERVEPTAKVRAFCADYSRASYECGIWFSTTDCESVFGMHADDVIDALATCPAIVSCDEILACVEGAFAR